MICCMNVLSILADVKKCFIAGVCQIATVSMDLIRNGLFFTVYPLLKMSMGAIKYV